MLIVVFLGERTLASVYLEVRAIIFVYLAINII